MLLHRIDHAAHLLRRSLLVGVDRPQVQLLQPEIACQIAEGPLAGHQPALLFGQAVQRGADRPDRVGDLLLVGLGIGPVDIGMGRVVLHQCIADVVHVDDAVLRRHPCMRIGFAAVRAFRDRHGYHALRHHHARHLAQPMEELLEPALEVQPVPEHQLGALGAHQITRGGLVVVNLGARLGDRLHHRCVASHIARHVGDDREGGHHLQFGCGTRRIPGCHGAAGCRRAASGSGTRSLCPAGRLPGQRGQRQTGTQRQHSRQNLAAFLCRDHARENCVSFHCWCGAEAPHVVRKAHTLHLVLIDCK